MKKAKVLVESYNETIKNHFDRFYNENSKMIEKLAKNDNKFMEYMNRSFESLDNTVNAWEDTPLHGLDGMSPKEYIGSIKEIDKLIEVFKQVALEIDDENMPSVLVERIKDFGETAVSALLQISLDPSLINSEENISVVVNAANILGLLKEPSAVNGLITLLYTCKEDDELVLETVANALKEIGTAALEPLLEKVEASTEITHRDEYIAECLAQIGRDNKSERIFMCLKSIFRRMDNKVLGAIYLGDYGDGRAIPALRGYVEKNLDEIDQETFYEISYAVERLGGDMSDIEVDFNDYLYDEGFTEDEIDEEWDE